MKLHELHAPEGAKKTRKRVGRGPGSGNGKTAGKGHKGQKSRSGSRKRPGFEGGQMPLYRRLPKRGFNNTVFQDKWVVVNVGDFARFEEQNITPDFLRGQGVVKGTYEGVKILGDGKLERVVHVKAHAISEGARRKIEAAGGTFEVLSR